MNNAEIKEKLIDFIASLKSISKNQITDETALISEGILDSISMLTTINFIEENFGIEFEAHEATEENLNTINLMMEFILAKKN